MSASPILQSMTIRAICPNGEVWSIRTRATVGLKTETTGLRSLPSRASAAFQSAAILPGCGDWRTAIERTQTPAVLAVRRLLQRFAGFVNIFRPQLTAGKCFSFLRSLVQNPQKSDGVDLVLFGKNHHPLLTAVHTENSSGGVSSNETKDRFQIRQEFFRG